MTALPFTESRRKMMAQKLGKDCAEDMTNRLLSDDKALGNLVFRFGVDLGFRIYACALIQKEKMEPQEDDEEGEVSTLDAIRYTVGIIKRMRTQATEHGNPMTWDFAVDRLEMEQVEGRKGKIILTKVEGANVEAIQANRTAVNRARRAFFLEQEHERIAKAYQDNPTEATETAMIMNQFMTGLTARQRGWFSAVLNGLRNGQELTRRQSQAISNRYTPKGVTTKEFIELAIRYA